MRPVPAGLGRGLAAVLAVLVLTACGGSPAGASHGKRPVAALSSGSSAAVGTGVVPAPAASTMRAGATASATSSPTVSVPAITPSGHQVFTRLPSDVGTLLQTTLAGAASGVRLRVWVWLPPQYAQPAYAHTAFPALMLYPGGSGAGYNTWAGRQYGAREVVATGAGKGTVTPFVFVMPEMQPSARLDTECADLPGQPKVGTFLAVDVRTMVQDNFRVMRDRLGWGAAGASWGAYCASRLVFDHPDAYAAAVSIAGYFTIETPLPGAKDPGVRAQDPAAIATANPPNVSILLWSGARNRYDLRDATTFLAAIKPPTQAELRILPGGRHLTTDFAKMIPDSFAYLTAHLAHPTPLPGG